MSASALSVGAILVMAAPDFPAILEALKHQGYRTVGPRLKDGQLIYGDLTGAQELPAGWTDLQEPGSFRLQRRSDEAIFGYGVGQHSWKQFLFPSRHLLWQAERQDGGFRILPASEEIPRYAFIGVRACDLQAILIQDRVFLRGPQPDPVYQARRLEAFILAVHCGERECGTGFCRSMGAGPRVSSGFDLALDEVIRGSEHYFLVEVGSERGAAVLKETPHRQAAAGELEAAGVAATRMGRELDTRGLKELLYRNYENPRWDEVAARCLSCGNCAWVCPTCFCHTMEDVTDLTGAVAERWRRQDVCFTVDHSYIHGGSIRPSPRSRYRQWLTHKLAAWIDQFGCSGCVGCGRCLTWCPVGIDLTAEVRAIREAEASLKETEHGDQ